MKYFVFLLLLPISLSAQKKTYFSVTAGVMGLQGEEVKPSLSLSFGAHPDYFVFGAGVGITSYSGRSYVPVFIEIGYINRKKTAPFVLVKGGYGVYSNQANNYSVKTTGGGYFNGSAGISLKNKGRTNLLLGGGFVYTGFNAGYNNSKPTGYGVNGYTIFFSFVL